MGNDKIADAFAKHHLNKEPETNEPEIPEMLPRPKAGDPAYLDKSFAYTNQTIRVVDARTKAGFDPYDIYSTPEGGPA